MKKKLYIHEKKEFTRVKWLNYEKKSVILQE